MGARTRSLLRHTTMALIVLLLAALATMISSRMRSRARPVAEMDSGQFADGADDPVEGIYNDFKYVETVAGQLVFVLNSVRTLGKSSGWHEIEGVRLELYDRGRPGPVVSCEAARFNVETRDAALRGPILVEFPGGALLNSDSGHFEASARRFVSDSQVLFTDGSTVGRAGGAAYSLADDRLELSDNAVLQSGGGVSLRAARIEYDRREGTIVVPDGCVVEQAGTTIQAPRALIDLEPGGNRPRRITFAEGASVRGLDPDGTVTMEATGQRVVADRDQAGVWQVAATTTGPWIEVRQFLGDGFFSRIIRAQELTAAVGPSGPLNMRADLAVCIDEVPVTGDPRRARGDKARVWFEDARPADVELIGNVVLRAGDLEARGHRARISSSSGVTLLQGDPTGPRRTLIASGRGRVQSDQAQLFDRDGRVEARGNVQGEIEGMLMPAPSSAGAPGPLHLAAGVLDISDDGDTFRLRDTARLWQDRGMLFADDILYRRATEVLDATGHVRMTLPAPETAAEAGEGSEVVVDARSLHFDRRARQAVYTGNVRYSDPGHTMSATELNVLLDEEEAITALEATGSVEFVDLESGQRMTGQVARRDMATATVHVTGSPVRLTDRSGTVISSSSLTWDQASGSVTVAGGTETTYYPEETP